MQPEHQEHLSRPAAESLHRDQPFDHLLVFERLELVEQQPLVGNARAQIVNGPGESKLANIGISLPGNRATNRPKIVAAALVDSCWLTMAPMSAVR